MHDLPHSLYDRNLPHATLRPIHSASSLTNPISKAQHAISAMRTTARSYPQLPPNYVPLPSHDKYTVLGQEEDTQSETTEPNSDDDEERFPSHHSKQTPPTSDDDPSLLQHEDTQSECTEPNSDDDDGSLVVHIVPDESPRIWTSFTGKQLKGLNAFMAQSFAQSESAQPSSDDGGSPTSPNRPSRYRITSNGKYLKGLDAFMAQSFAQSESTQPNSDNDEESPSKPVQSSKPSQVHYTGSKLHHLSGLDAFMTRSFPPQSYRSGLARKAETKDTRSESTEPNPDVNEERSPVQPTFSNNPFQIRNTSVSTRRLRALNTSTTYPSAPQPRRRLKRKPEDDPHDPADIEAERRARQEFHGAKVPKIYVTNTDEDLDGGTGPLDANTTTRTTNKKEKRRKVNPEFQPSLSDLLSRPNAFRLPTPEQIRAFGGGTEGCFMRIPAFLRGTSIAEEKAAEAKAVVEASKAALEMGFGVEDYEVLDLDMADPRVWDLEFLFDQV